MNSIRSVVKKRRSRRKTIWRSVSYKLSEGKLLRKHPLTTFVSRILPIKVHSGSIQPVNRFAPKISKFKNSGVQKAIERRFRMRSLI